VEGAIPEADARPWLFDEYDGKDKTPWEKDLRKTEYARELLKVQPLEIADDANARAACVIGLHIYPMKASLLDSETRNPTLFH
jgi:hypothetical protein